MKVLMTADTVGGVWTYALELCRALGERGVEIVLATQGAPLRDGQRRAASALPNVAIEESSFRLEWMSDPWPDVQRGDAWLLELEAKHAPDVVHLNDLTRGALAWRAPALVVGHSCVLSWWRAVRREPVPPQWNRYHERVGRSLRAAAIVVAPGAAMLSELIRHYGPLPRTRVIHNGRDAGAFRIRDKERFVFGAGRVWDEAKNLAALGRVARALPWSVFIAGDSRHPDGGEASCGAAHLIGLLDEAALARWYGAASIYALPARYEPFGLSALEAALAGCALVLGDIPSLREIWGDGADFVDPFDDAALKHALERLIAEPRRRRELVVRSRSTALSLSVRRMTESYMDTYRQLAPEAAGAMKGVPACAS
jgi:glycogen synthase